MNSRAAGEFKSLKANWKVIPIDKVRFAFRVGIAPVSKKEIWQWYIDNDISNKQYIAITFYNQTSGIKNNIKAKTQTIKN